jgi:hypothetical protein
MGGADYCIFNCLLAALQRLYLVCVSVLPSMCCRLCKTLNEAKRGLLSLSSSAAVIYLIIH